MTITWSLAKVACDKKLTMTKTCTSIAGHLDGHADAPVQCGVHRPIAQVQVLTQSY